MQYYIYIYIYLFQDTEYFMKIYCQYYTVCSLDTHIPDSGIVMSKYSQYLGN